MSTGRILYLTYTLILCAFVSSAFTMSDEEALKKLTGTWRAVEESVEEGVTYKYIEIITFSKRGKYRGSAETLKNGKIWKYEEFRGKFAISNDTIRWEPKNGDPWSDDVSVTEDTLIFTDKKGGSMSYVRVN